MSGLLRVSKFPVANLKNGCEGFETCFRSCHSRHSSLCKFFSCSALTAYDSLLTAPGVNRGEMKN